MFCLWLTGQKCRALSFGGFSSPPEVCSGMHARTISIRIRKVSMCQQNAHPANWIEIMSPAAHATTTQWPTTTRANWLLIWSRMRSEIAELQFLLLQDSLASNSMTTQLLGNNGPMAYWFSIPGEYPQHLSLWPCEPLGGDAAMGLGRC